MTTRTILVTGGAGFIGSHLCGRLVSDSQNRVISLDDYSSGVRSNEMAGVTYFHGSTEHINQYITQAPDLIFHLGEYARVERSFQDVDRVIRSNMTGTFQVMEFARQHRAKIVYAGSSTKFADGGLGRNGSPYAWTKAANTELVRNYGTWFGLRYAITYFYNVYGPREISHGPMATVIGIFAEQWATKQPLSVVAPGTQRRNFTHVEDIVAGLILVGERGEGDDFGLGSEEKYSVRQVAELFGGPITTVPERPGNRMDAELDLSRSRGELGWYAKHRLVNYIQDLKSRC